MLTNPQLNDSVFLTHVNRYSSFYLRQICEILESNNPPKQYSKVRIISGTRQPSVERDIARYTVRDDGSVDLHSERFSADTNCRDALFCTRSIESLPDDKPCELIIRVRPYSANVRSGNAEAYCDAWDLPMPDPLITE